MQTLGDGEGVCVCFAFRDIGLIVCRGRAFWDCTRLSIWYLREGPKAMEGWYQDGLERNKHRKIEG